MLDLPALCCPYRKSVEKPLAILLSKPDPILITDLKLVKARYLPDGNYQSDSESMDLDDSGPDEAHPTPESIWNPVPSEAQPGVSQHFDRTVRGISVAKYRSILPLPSGEISPVVRVAELSDMVPPPTHDSNGQLLKFDTALQLYQWNQNWARAHGYSIQKRGSIKISESRQTQKKDSLTGLSDVGREGTQTCLRITCSNFYRHPRKSPFNLFNCDFQFRIVQDTEHDFWYNEHGTIFKGCGTGTSIKHKNHPEFLPGQLSSNPELLFDAIETIMYHPLPDLRSYENQIEEITSRYPGLMLTTDDLRIIHQERDKKAPIFWDKPNNQVPELGLQNAESYSSVAVGVVGSHAANRQELALANTGDLGLHQDIAMETTALTQPQALTADQFEADESTAFEKLAGYNEISIVQSEIEPTTPSSTVGEQQCLRLGGNIPEQGGPKFGTSEDQDAFLQEQALANPKTFLSESRRHFSDDLEKERKEIEVERSRVQLRVEGEAANNKRLRLDLDSVEAKNRSLLKDVGVLKQEIILLNEEGDRLRKEMQMQATANDELLMRSEARLELLDAQRQSWLLEVHASKQEAYHMRSECQRFESELSTLRHKECDALQQKTKIDDLQSNNQNLMSETTKLRQELACCEQNLRDTQEGHHCLEYDLKSIKDMATDLRRQVGDLEDNLKARNSAFGKLEDDMKEANNHILNLLYDNADLGVQFAIMKGAKRGDADSIRRRLPEGKVTNVTVRRLMENPHFDRHYVQRKRRPNGQTSIANTNAYDIPLPQTPTHISQSIEIRSSSFSSNQEQRILPRHALSEDGSMITVRRASKCLQDTRENLGGNRETSEMYD